MTSQYPDPQRSSWPPAPAPRRRVWPWAVGVSLLILFVVIGCTAAVSGAKRTAAGSTSSSAGSTSTYVAAEPTPTNAAPLQQQSGPSTTATDGTYEVGPDLAPGKYKTPGPDGSSPFRTSCYWERAKDDSGEFGSIKANDNISGPGTLTVKAGEVLKLSGPCTWTKQ